MNKFNTKFSNYEVVETKDGFPTLFSEHYNELCHSNAGSYKETFFTYVKALDIKNIFLKQEKTTIFEMGYGAGIGLLTTLDEYFNSGTTKRLEFHSMEIDEELVYWSFNNVFNKRPKYNFVNNFKKINKNLIIIEDRNIQLYIHIGDARKILPQLSSKLSNQVDAIYQDAFSPQKNPKLWTTEWFQELYKIGNDNAVLSTYSASTIIRKALLLAGWKLGNFQGFGTKRAMTRAWKNGEMDENLKNKVLNSKLEAFSDKFILKQSCMKP